MYSQTILLVFLLLAAERISFGFPAMAPASSNAIKEIDQRSRMVLHAKRENDVSKNKARNLFDFPSEGSSLQNNSAEDIDNFLDSYGDEGNTVTKREFDFSEKNGNLQVGNAMDTCVSVPYSNDDNEIPRNFNYFLLDPALTTTEQFVTKLELYTLNHLAINHHFLQKVSSATIGREETAKLLLQFFTAYSRFNQDFAGNVAKLRDIISNPKHKEILDANLAEENGIYNEGTLIELEGMGIERNSVQGIRHPDLYQDMVTNLGLLLESSYDYEVGDIIPENVMTIKKEAVAELTADGKFGLLAGIYFGSELIVPELYSKLLQGLRLSCDISNNDARFLILHIDVDQAHAKNLRKIVIENCITMEDRIRIVKNTEKILNARVEFYDALISSNFGSQNWDD